MDKITVAFVAYDRPKYVEEALTSLARCEGFMGHVDRVVASVDDSATNFESRRCADVIARWAHRYSGPGYPYVTTLHQPKRRGIVGNTVLALKAAFDGGAETVLMMEDDAVLAQDAVYLSRWFSRQDHDRYLLYGMSTGNPNLWVEGAERRMIELNLHPCPFAYVVHKSRWPFILENWCCKTYHPCGWSWSLTYAARMAGRATFMAPHLPRVVNIGREKGTNESPETWDRVHKDVPLHASTYRGPYDLVGEIGPGEASMVDGWMRPEIDKEESQKFDGWLGFGRPEELG